MSYPTQTQQFLGPSWAMLLYPGLTLLDLLSPIPSSPTQWISSSCGRTRPDRH